MKLRPSKPPDIAIAQIHARIALEAEVNVICHGGICWLGCELASHSQVN
jgi:hypothetical protein